MNKESGVTEAESRLRQWIKDYGATKHRVFIEDLEAVLDQITLERNRGDFIRAEMEGMEKGFHPQVAALELEIIRLKSGRFTEEEFQNLCHGFSEDDQVRFKKGCEEYQAKLFGFTRESLAARTPEWVENASQRFHGLMEPCCECGEDYPRADLALKGCLVCKACRDSRRGLADDLRMWGAYAEAEKPASRVSNLSTLASECNK